MGAHVSFKYTKPILPLKDDRGTSWAAQQLDLYMHVVLGSLLLDPLYFEGAVDSLRQVKAVDLSTNLSVR